MHKIYACFDVGKIDINTFEHYLPPERREKVLRFQREIDKRNCVAAYLLLLYGLYTDYGISDPILLHERRGKPYLRDCPDIHFNICHCPYGCVCAISDSPIGVDIRDIRPFSWPIAERCCSETELDLLKHSINPASEFTKMWATKERYLKMKGTGISENLYAIDTTKLTNQISTLIYNSCYIAVACAESFWEESICTI